MKFQDVFRCIRTGNGPNDFKLVPRRPIETVDSLDGGRRPPYGTDLGTRGLRGARTSDGSAFVVPDGTPLRIDGDGQTLYAVGPIVVSPERPLPRELGARYGSLGAPTNDRSHVTANDFGRVVCPSEINKANREFREKKAREAAAARGWEPPDAA